jgi:5-methyltetrahydrofolate--homocysteine methyltransferase
MARDVAAEIRTLAEERILVLDGAWGVLLQGRGLSEADFRGERFAAHPSDLVNDPDLLNLTQPDLVREVHDAYFAAGADIATTNTFTATSIGQADYGLEDAVYDMNYAGARIARESAGDRFVAGSVGPLNIALSLSPRVDEPGYRTHSFAAVKDTYAEQIRALVDGGVDLLLIETIFDPLNAKAAIMAARETAPDMPLWISVTIVDLSGRTLTGQTTEAFWTSIEHAEPLLVGVNCSLGAKEMRPYVAALSRIAPCFVSCHPNAGLPNAFGGYDETPDVTSALLREFALDGFLNVVGSCCGSHPEHTKAIVEAVRGLEPRRVPPRRRVTCFSGLETFEIGEETGFVVIGERTNVTGSARFRRLVESGDFPAAIAVAVEQVRGGANMIDINMDADLLEGEEAMRTFLNVIATEPEVARVPVMIDSSKWTVLEAGLQCLQGKGIVNSISLKEGEADFLRQARAARGDLRPRIRPARRRGRLSRRGHHLRPECARSRDRDRGARRLRPRLHREPAADQRAVSGRTDLRWHLEPQLLVPRQRRGARGDARGVSLSRHSRRARHGHRQRRAACGLRGDRARVERAR